MWWHARAVTLLDASLHSVRFQQVMVAEPSVEAAVSILRGLKDRYERHHGVRIRDSALVLAAKLSARYITARFLPDKAIDLIDEACAQVRGCRCLWFHASWSASTRAPGARRTRLATRGHRSARTPATSTRSGGYCNDEGKGRGIERPFEGILAVCRAVNHGGQRDAVWTGGSQRAREYPRRAQSAEAALPGMARGSAGTPHAVLHDCTVTW